MQEYFISGSDAELFPADGTKHRTAYDFVYLASDVQALAKRCIEPIEDRMVDARNERASYAGFEERQRRYDHLIAEDEALLAELRAIVGMQV